MNMTEKNGQPSMEEILASIRRIIAEEPATPRSNGEFRGTPIMLKGDGVLEDAGDFDLPAIFRASPPVQTERPTPLLGRLSDAIRNATAAQPEARSYVNGDDSVEPVEAEAHLVEPAYSGLSSLKPARVDAHNGAFPAEPSRPAAAGVPAVSPSSYEGTPSGYPASRSVVAAANSGDEPKRVMAPFKDTHFLRITPSSEGAAANVAVPVSPAADAARTSAPIGGSQPNFSSIIPGQTDRGSLAPPAASRASVQGAPPPLPVSEPPRGDMAEGVGTIEDTTADLLRPMLRQWLADNMPRMVEKALHIEIAESVKGTKKP